MRMACRYTPLIPLKSFEKIAQPRALARKVYCRIAVEQCRGANARFRSKFGTTLDRARARSDVAKRRLLGLVPHGLSFHVGSQQTGTAAYEMAIAQVAMLFTDLKARRRWSLKMLNLGGGFPDPIPG